MKAIQTLYKGYRFRSRTEARWAVYFDAIGIQWEYEKEGFHLASGELYLPDFWLPEVKMWAEVKGEHATIPEMDKVWHLGTESGHRCLMLEGPPDARAYVAWGTIQDGIQTSTWDYVLTNFHGYVQAEGRFYSSPGCGCAVERRAWGCDLCRFPDTVKAVWAARSARFEFGESG